MLPKLFFLFQAPFVRVPGLLFLLLPYSLRLNVNILLNVNSKRFLGLQGVIYRLTYLYARVGVFSLSDSTVWYIRLPLVVGLCTNQSAC